MVSISCLLVTPHGLGGWLYSKLTFGLLEGLTKLNNLINILWAKCLLNDNNIALKPFSHK